MGLIRYKTDGFVKSTRYCVGRLKNTFCYFPKKVLLHFIIRIERYFPIKDYIVFECENDMDDNPRAVYEYLLNENWNEKHKLVWIVRDVQTCKKLYNEKNVTFLSRFDRSFINRIRLEYYLSTAKWFVFSHPYWFKKIHKKQIVININHGTPFKGRSIKDNSQIGDSFDYLLSSGKNVIEKNSEFWGCDITKVFVCGLPRNDFLTEGKKEDIFPLLFLWQKNERVIICMPTYKQSAYNIDSKKRDPYSLDVVKTEDELKELNQYLKKKDTHLIVKPHPLQVIDDLYLNDLSNIHYIDNKILLQKKIILYKLIGCCDGLITDCSSVFFDYMLLKRPIAFLMNNVNEYERGFIIDNHEQYMTGDKIYNLNDLIKYIGDVSNGIDRYRMERERINLIINGDDQIQNSRKFCEIMFKLESQISNVR